jgi:hypothetical protein
LQAASTSTAGPSQPAPSTSIATELPFATELPWMA